MSVLQTVMVSYNCSTTPLAWTDKLTTQLFARLIVGFTMMEHAPVPTIALQFAGIPFGSAVTVHGPPWNAEPHALPETVKAPSVPISNFSTNGADSPPAIGLAGPVSDTKVAPAGSV